MTARLLVSAAHKSSGKTTITLGLCAALAARGLVVQPFKKGPDYIDPMWLGLAAGRPCYNLDPHLMDDGAMARCFERGALGAQITLVEGNKGLYDGLALDGSNSNAALAHRFDLPVLLVIDARGMTRGIAPLLLGYQAFDPALRIAGVVLNRVGGPRHEGKLRAVIEHYTDLPVIGAVAEDARLQVVERHLGLQPCAERDDAAIHVAELGRLIAAQVDLDRVLDLARSVPAWRDGLAASTGQSAAKETANDIDDVAKTATAITRHSTPASAACLSNLERGGRPRPLRIGIARDRAFSFYYPDDLEAFGAEGAELVPIDTLHDRQLPELDGLFIGGGFPEACMAELEANAAMRSAIRQAIETGLPTYAECGGLMYLSRSISWQGRSAAMVGVIPGDAVMRPRPVGRGYVQLQATAAMPWPRLEGQHQAEVEPLVHGHEFHHSSLECLSPGLSYAWRVRRGHGIDGANDGLTLHNLLASYSHLRDATGAAWVRRFVAHVRRHRDRCTQLQTPAALAATASTAAVPTAAVSVPLAA